METKDIKEGEVLYKIDDETDMFYIVLSGVLFMETVIEICNSNRYPVGIKKNGRLKLRLNKISYRVKELFSGDFFGHEEIIDDCKRKCKVFAAEECEIFYLSKEKFYKYFNKDIEEHKQPFQQLIHEPKPKNEAEKFNFYTRFDNMQIKDTIIETDLLRSKKSSAILNAINLNTLQVCGREIHDEDRTINKFKHLLKRARNKMCLGVDEINQIIRMKVLDTKVEFT